MIENRNLIIREMLDQIQHETLRHGPNINQKDIRDKMKDQAARMQKIIQSTMILPNTTLAEDEDFLYHFNCYAYALGLWTQETTYRLIQEYLKETGKHLVSSFIMKKLILNKTILIQDSPLLNNLVIYFDRDQKIKHAGIVKELSPLMIESKWGDYPVMQHTLWNVPLSYGSDIGFYHLPTLDKIEFEINNIILD